MTGTLLRKSLPCSQPWEGAAINIQLWRVLPTQVLQTSVPSKTPPLVFPLLPPYSIDHTVQSQQLVGLFSHFLGAASQMVRGIKISLFNGLWFVPAFHFLCDDYNSKRMIAFPFPVFHEFLWCCFGNALARVELLGNRQCRIFCHEIEFFTI